MFVKVINKYRDTLLNSELPQGVILEVSEDRGATLIKAKVAEEFTFSAPKSKKNKSEEITVEINKEVPPLSEEELELMAKATPDVLPVDGGWKDPKTTDTATE